MYGLSTETKKMSVTVNSLTFTCNCKDLFQFYVLLAHHMPSNITLLMLLCH